MLNFKPKLKRKNFNLQKEEGFTLVESLIAIALVTVGLVGAVTLITYAISTVSFVRGKLLASQFAQEGIEVVRNMRDNNWLAGKIATNNWWEGLNYGENNFIVPVFTDNPSGDWSLVPATSDNRKIYLFYNNETNEKFYGQGNLPSSSGWERKEISFERWLRLVYKGEEDKLEVISYVVWREKGRTHNFEIKDYLYNWQTGLGVCPPGYTFSQDSHIYGAPSGISYYAGGGGGEEDNGPCTGQEMVRGSENPYRSLPSQNVCVGDSSSSQEYCSKRLSSAICEPVNPCVHLEVGEFKLIVDPF